MKVEGRGDCSCLTSNLERRAFCYRSSGDPTSQFGAQFSQGGRLDPLIGGLRTTLSYVRSQVPTAVNMTMLVYDAV
jgi:hypothetical protein